MLDWSRRSCGVRDLFRVAWVAFLVAATQGCVVAAAGAGAAAGIHLTSQGAEALVEAEIGRTATAVAAVFREMGIRQTGESTQQSGAEREFKGETDDIDVTVKLESRDDGTRIEVSARRSLTSWDKEYAQQLLGRIVRRV